MKTQLTVDIMLTLTCVIVAGFCAITSVNAQQHIYGTSGSPGATTTIDGKQLPPMPDEKLNSTQL